MLLLHVHSTCSLTLAFLCNVLCTYTIWSMSTGHIIAAVAEPVVGDWLELWLLYRSYFLERISIWKKVQNIHFLLLTNIQRYIYYNEQLRYYWRAKCVQFCTNALAIPAKTTLLLRSNLDYCILLSIIWKLKIIIELLKRIEIRHKARNNFIWDLNNC